MIEVLRSNVTKLLAQKITLLFLDDIKRNGARHMDDTDLDVFSSQYPVRPPDHGPDGWNSKK